MDMGGREGNYPESSASSMLVYALAKAAGKGYLPPSYMMAATKGYQGILDRFIEVDADALVNIHRACAVAGLGGDPYRDGSYEYYIKERIRSNDPKAVGPFILASLEMEKSGSR
jgi:unsaturated rhamnogalacturonyl hydrolase